MNAARKEPQLICQMWQLSRVSASQNQSQMFSLSLIIAGWDQIQTIDSLLRKGGFRGAITPVVRSSIKLIRYTSQEIHMTYQSYMEYRDRYSTAGIITCRVQC